MKSAVASVLVAGALALGACAHTDQMAMSAPSALSPGQIEAELAAISAEMSALWQGRSYPVGSPAEPAPMRISGYDSNGVLFQGHTPGGMSGYSYPRSTSSRPWGYARLEDLNRRRAELYAERSKRMSSQH